MIKKCLTVLTMLLIFQVIGMGSVSGEGNRFWLPSDGTVVDNHTGLQWEQGYGSHGNWIQALAYCENLELANYSDWRLPNIKELQTIIDSSKLNPSVFLEFSCQADPYWSSSTYISGVLYAWSVDFDKGRISHQSKNDGAYIRCVR